MDNFEINVPSDWEIKKISWLFKAISSGSTPPSNKEEYYYPEDVAWLNTGDLNDGYVKRSKKFVSNAALNDFSTLQVYPENSLIMAMYGATIGKLGITTFKTTTNQACCVLAEPYGIEQKFMFYWLLGHREQIIQMSQGGGQPNISQGIIKSIRLGIPNIKLQRKIVEFLDEKYKEINKVILKKEKLIKLLEEKRQSIITEAVTKGLNSHVKMKDSGVEWIGEIPEHWSKTRLDFISSVKARLGWKALKAEEYVDVGYIFLATPNLKYHDIDFDNVNYITEERYIESPEIMLKEGDVLLAKDGSTLGITNVVRSLPAAATVNSSIAVLRLKKEMNSIYFYYYLKSQYIQDTINQIKDGMGVPHLFQADIKKFNVLLPPIEEQTLIGRFLDEEILGIDNLILSIKEQNQKLKEYRQSLIYEAVTGKIVVREPVAEK